MAKCDGKGVDFASRPQMNCKMSSKMSRKNALLLVPSLCGDHIAIMRKFMVRR